MRGILIGSMLALTAYPALSSSIEELNSTDDKYGSIEEIHCTTCTDIGETETSEYDVPELTPGTQRVEIMDTEKGKELVRVDAWFGGSPVRRVSYSQAPLVEQARAFREEQARQAEIAAAQDAAKKEAERKAAAMSKTIDSETMTSAVTAGSQTVAAGMETDAPFDPNKLELRLK